MLDGVKVGASNLRWRRTRLRPVLRISRFLQRKSAPIQSMDYAAHKSGAQRPAFPLARRRLCYWS